MIRDSMVCRQTYAKKDIASATRCVVLGYAAVLYGTVAERQLADPGDGIQVPASLPGSRPGKIDRDQIQRMTSNRLVSC